MQKIISRAAKTEVSKRLNRFPVVALLGPRQCGKSTLAKTILQDIKNSIYIDLERPSDINKLSDPEAFFKINSDKLVCLDEIQRVPEIFPVLRSIIDENRRNSRFLILGSASPQLIRQSSETLAGRISFIELTPFLITEIGKSDNEKKLRNLWLKGGYPLSYLTDRPEDSMQWRIDFIRTFLERDIPSLGINISTSNMRRLWTMLAHTTGQLLNSSRFGESLGITHKTVRSYIDLLEQTFLVRVLNPYYVNLKKRLVKSPKIYVRDSGILHALLNVQSFNDLMGHPVYGASWEGFVIENIISNTVNLNAFFFRTATGDEIDLIVETPKGLVAIECKSSSSPKISKSLLSAVEMIKPAQTFIVAPVKDSYPIGNGITVVSLKEMISIFHSL
ncbi:MAG: ATP-binding protein [Spirochaetes bacterium]|nr:ATP-binding protein [Spirochaetota bacterium]